MLKAARKDGFYRQRGAGRDRAPPVRRNVRTNPHPIDDTHRRSQRATASHDEYVLARGVPNRFETSPEGLGTSKVRVVTNALSGCCKEEIQLEISKTELLNQCFEKLFQMLYEFGIGWVECIGKFVLAGRPHWIVNYAERAVVVADEPS